MKHLTLIVFLLSASIAQAQNHVPNGNFEQYNSCPNTDGQINKCIGWSSLIDTNSSPDFYHTCGTNGFKIPSLTTGYQQPASGNGFAAAITIATNNTPPITPSTNYREVITRQIIPLVINKKYEVSLSVSRANNFRLGSDNMSVFFFDTIGAVTINNLQSIVPQINFQQIGVISDTTNWVRLKAYFQADSAYDHIAIGGFLNTNIVDIDTFPSAFPHGYAYYYIDSIVVKPMNIQLNIYDSIYCALDSCIISFETSFTLDSSNTFIAQLSDATGSFLNPTTIDSLHTDTSGTIRCIIPNSLTTGNGYKIRLISSSPKDTIIGSKLIKIGNFDSTNTYVQIYCDSVICEGQTLSFTNTSTPNYLTYLWIGPNSFTSTLAAPNITNIALANSGSYYLTSKLYGCQLLDTLQVLVKPSPKKPVANSNTPICEYDTLLLTAASTTTGVTYSWTGPFNYTSSLQNPTRTNAPLTAGGFYTVAATLNGCSNYDTIGATVKDAPDSITLSSNTPLCTDDTLKLYADSSTGNVLYSWAGPNGFSSSANDTIIANAGFNNTGWYTMTVSLNGCTYTDSTYAVVTQKPSAPLLSYNNPLCIGEQLQLNANSLVSGVTYSWTGPNSFSSSLKNPSKNNVQLADTGNYYATVTYNNCTSPLSSIKVTTNPTPFVVISTPDDTICNGKNASYTAIPVNAGTNIQYIWKINAQPQAATGATFSTTTLNNNDIVLCEMTDSTQCTVPYTDQSNQIKMTVLPWLAPSVSISANPTGVIIPWDYVQFTATPTNAGNNPKYQWKRNGKDIIGATSYVWSANNLNDNDTISVDLISDYECPQPTMAKSNSIVVRIATHIQETITKNNLTLAPNPNKGKFTLSGQLQSNGIATIQVINMLGQTVYQKELTIKNYSLQENITLKETANGLYLFKLIINQQQTQIKFRVD